MRKSLSLMLVFAMILTLLLSTVASASMESSYYLQYYNAYISKTGNTINIYFDVQGTRYMDKIGVTEIYLYERASSSDSWSPVQTYLSTDPTYAATMINTNAIHKADHVSYSGSSAKQYMACITVYAEKDGGSDSRDIVAY